MNVRRLGGVLGLLCLLPAAARAEENRVVHVLIVADTVDRNVGRLTWQDAQTIHYLIKNSIPAHQLTLNVLCGEQATPANIGRYYANLRVERRDAVVLFYSGHGGWDPDRGHLLTLNAGIVVRKDLEQVMTGKGGRLTVLLTNCCSNWIRTPAFGRDADNTGAVPLAGFSPVLRCLLFQHQGVVNITAAQKGTSAYGNDEGGWFTLALVRVLQASPRVLDLNGDGFVSWDEVFQLVRQETRAIFADRASPALRRQQETQEPIHGELGRRIAGVERIPDQVVEERRGRGLAGVTISNPTDATIVYQLRWGTGGAMKTYQLPPNCHIRHWCQQNQDGRAPLPQICYRKGFQGDLVGDTDFFDLKWSAIVLANRKDLAKRYDFAIKEQAGRRFVELGDPDLSPPQQPARRFGGVTIANPTDATIVYQFRWGDQGEWKEYRLTPHLQMRHWHPQDEKGKVPTPQIYYRKGFEGDTVGDADSFNLACGYINPDDNNDLGKRYDFAIKQNDARQFVELVDPDK